MYSMKGNGSTTKTSINTFCVTTNYSTLQATLKSIAPLAITTLDFIIGILIFAPPISYRLVKKKLFSFGRLHPHVLDRFRNAFNESSNTLVTIKSTHFVLLNSMTLSRDGCYFCVMAERDIRRISRRLDCAKRETSSDSCKNLVDKLGFYSRPVLLQHFPTYRKSDEQCEEFDAPEVENYRENWEVLSKNATEFLGTSLNPRVAFSGHSHHYCRTYNSWSVEEYTIASFSWRNKVNPSFLLVSFSHNILKQ